MQVAPELVYHPEGHRFPHSRPHAQALGESVRRRLAEDSTLS